MGLTVDVPQGAVQLEERWSRLGEVVLLLGLPIGMLFVSLVLLLDLSGGLEPQGLIVDSPAAVLLFYFLLMLPYSVAGGALEAVYGARTRVVPCCFFVMLGVAAGIVFPVVVVSGLGVLSDLASMWALLGAGTLIQMVAAGASLILVRRTRTVQGLRARAASG